ncbi:MAG: CBS domain-containing protein [Planctomycetota bacterium]
MLSETKYFFFLSDLIHKKVKKSDGETIGRVVDVSVIHNPSKIYPELLSLIIAPGLFKKHLNIPIISLEPFELPIEHLYLKSDAVINEISSLDNSNNISLLKETFLDKQILDTSGCKVVRVNDLHFLKEKNNIWVVHVDIGFRGIVRRLGWLQVLDTIMEWVFSYKPQERFVSWKYVRTIPQSGVRRNDMIALAPAYQCLTNLNPVDLSDILSDINRDERIAMFKMLDISTAADAMVELDLKMQKELFESLEKQQRLQLILLIPDNKLADLLNHLGRRKADEVIRQLPLEKAEKIKGLLLHPEQTAGALMTTQYFSLNKDLTVEESFNKLREISVSSNDSYFYYVYVIDVEQNLIGVVSLRKLLATQSASKLSEVMNSNTIKIKPFTKYRKIIELCVKYNIDALPVVDNHNKIKGIVLLKDALKNTSIN